MRKIPTEWDKVDSIVYESYDMWFTLLHQNQNQKGSPPLEKKFVSDFDETQNLKSLWPSTVWF